MIKQKILWEDRTELSDLFFNGNGNITKNGLSLKKGFHLAFDTYFNMLSVFKWIKYTRIKKIGVLFSIKGKGCLQIIGVDINRSTHEHLLNSMEFNHSESAKDITIWMTLNETSDFVYPKIEASSDLVIESASYLFDVEPFDIGIGCCICTYKREADVIRNVTGIAKKIWANDESFIKNRLEVYIADNGKSLDLTQEQNLSSFTPNIHVFPNKNYGGSGGFTRCMIESVFKRKDSELDYIILMDDDAIIEPFVIERTALFLSALKDEYRDYFVGGAMFFLEKPTIEKENGCFFDNGHLVMRNYYSNMTNRNEVIKNELGEGIQYNGWYYCCIPTKVVKTSRLPIPIFFTWDDAEYGIRNARGRFITLNGICIWHPAHDAKPGSFRNYYGMRNTCIMRSEFEPHLSFRDMDKVYFRRLMLFLLQFQYNNARYLLQGIRDFYKGIDWFILQDTEELNNVIRKMYPDINIVNIESKPIFTDVKKLSKKKWLIYMTINMICPGRKKTYSIEAPRSSINYLFTNEVVFIDESTLRGYSFKRNIAEAMSILWDYFILRREIKSIHSKEWKKWHEGIKTIQTLDYWMSYLGI